MMRPLFAFLSVPVLIAASSAAAQTPTFFVAPNGADGNTGTTYATPFQTLERAQTAMQQAGTGPAITYLEGGTYPRSQALNLSGYYDQNKSWLAYPGQHPLLEGSGATAQAVVIDGFPGITIQGLTIDRFATSGIFAQYASALVISGNTIQNVTSPDWRTNTLGASIFLLNVQNSQVTNNTILNNTYTGIQVNAGGAGQTNSNTVVEGNTVTNVCTAVVDCGAIYLRDVGHQSTGEVVSGNTVNGFGPAANSTKGIYLDDEQSNVMVTRNTVFGSGTYAFQIHGGDGNMFVNNIFDVTALLKLALYQDDVTSGFPNYGMNGNVFTRNIVYSAATPPGTLWDYLNGSGGSIALPAVSQNIYHDAPHALVNAGTIVDAAPLFERPMFYSPALHKYQLKAASPALALGFLQSQ